MSRSTRGALVLLTAFSAALTMAPTPGDVGGCGQEPTLLDARVFFANKQRIDCQQCQECAIASQRCSDACARSQPVEEFPDACFPLVHDGEVCLRALIHASCSDYESFMADQSPTSPSECNFCPPEKAP